MEAAKRRDKGDETSAPQRRRGRRPSLTNEEFLKRAFELFTEQGFDGTTIDAISSQAGIAKRTIYQRYGDKKAVFVAAINLAIEEWVVPPERLQASETADLEVTLQAIGKILVDNILAEEGMRLLRLTNAESGRMPEIGEFTVRRGQDRTTAYLAGLFQRYAGSELNLRAAEDAAESFLHLVVGGPANAAAWGVRRSPSAIDRRIRYSVRLFLHGMAGAATKEDGYIDLKSENDRLKRILAETMIALDVAREKAGSPES